MFETISFDICALAILIIILAALSFRRSVLDEASRRLVYLVLVTIAAALLDIFANYNNGSSNKIEINYACSGLYYIFRNAAFYLYVSYIAVITGVWHKIRDTLLEKLRFIPLLFMVAIAISGAFTHYFYYYDSTHHYMRGKGFSIIYALGAIYVFFAVYYILKNVPLMGYRKTLSLISCAVFSLASSVVQYYIPYLVVDIFGFTLSLLFIVFFIDNPLDKVESTSLLMNNQAFINELRSIFFMNRSANILHININNYRAVEETLSYSNYLTLIKKLSNELRDINAKIKALGALYYLKDGRFRVILSERTVDKTEELSRALLEVFNSSMSINDVDILLESSICITQCPGDFNIFDDFVEFGSVAPRFEESGKIVYSSDILKDDDYKVYGHISKIVEEGIIDNRFELLYQPLYNVATGEYKDVVVYLILHSADNTVLKPEIFISAAEQNGSIIEIGDYVIDSACKFISSPEFEKTGIERVALKISVVRCLQKDFTRRVMETLRKYNVSPDKIRFYITESLASDNQKVYADNIQDLAKEGIAFAIDDYGMGYSNITTLSTLPIETVIFDKAFASSANDERVNAIFENSVDMIKALGKKVVVEGVEDRNELERFKSLGCDYIQGEAFAETMTKEKLIRFFDDLNA